MTNEEAATLLEQWSDEGLSDGFNEAATMGAAALRSPGAGAMREAAAQIVEHYREGRWVDLAAAIRALPLPAPEVPDKFAAFGRMVFDAAAGRFADGTMDETDHDNMELAVKAGLAEHVRYDPEKHGDVQDAEPGDKIVWWGAR